jgi:hypothetical protein
MNHDLTLPPNSAVRQTDGNTLLRMYDAAMAVFKNSARPRDREKADRIVQRVTKELERRKISR